MYNMGGTLQVDALSAAAVGLGTITGITSRFGSYSINLWDNSGIVLNSSLNAGLAEVELRASGGSITENSGDVISAFHLALVVDATPARSNVSLNRGIC